MRERKKKKAKFRVLDEQCKQDKQASKQNKRGKKSAKEKTSTKVSEVRIYYDFAVIHGDDDVEGKGEDEEKEKEEGEKLDFLLYLYFAEKKREKWLKQK